MRAVFVQSEVHLVKAQLTDGVQGLASGYRLKQSDEQATYTAIPPSVERQTQ